MTASLRCITCGQVVADPPQLHRMGDGSNCPTCRDRALDAIPAALPREAVEEMREELYQGELYTDDDDRAG